MTIREQTQEIERRTLSRYATLSVNSRGRCRPEEEDPIRPCFQRDRDRILHSKAFRRLKQKTQVFLSPEGDHYRTRLTHTLEVNQIARTIARALRLNEDLTEAIALGHDLGHTPFGHAGERALNRLCPGGFTHYRQSLRVVDKLEKDGEGLNLSWEVRNGIVTHTTGAWARTPEGCVVRRADHIAFLNHDIEDAVAAGVLDARRIPAEATAVLGRTKSQRITTMITDIVAHSQRADQFFARSRGRVRHPQRFHVFHRLCRQGSQARREKGGQTDRGAVRAPVCRPVAHAELLFTDRVQRGRRPRGDRLHQRYERRVRHAAVRGMVRAAEVAGAVSAQTKPGGEGESV